MRKSILYLLSLVPVLSQAQSNFTIQGKLGQETVPAKAYLIYRSPTRIVRDSASLDQGVFKFEGQTTEPMQAQLLIDHKGEGLNHLGRNADVLVLYLEPGSIRIESKDSIKHALISGSRLNDEQVKYKALMTAPEQAIALVNSDFAAASPDQKKETSFVSGLQGRFNLASADKHRLQGQFISQNPSSFVSLVALQDLAGPDPDIAVVEPIFKSLSLTIQNTAPGKQFAKAIEEGRSTAIGAMAPDFTQNNTEDQPVSLSSFRGKYVLVDFWASWCGPCRAENPNLLKAYQQYKTRNFTVLGVSLDRPGKKEDWLAAIQSDGLEWTQVSDLNFWNNTVAKQYGIRSIPQNYLIDPNGKIIGKNLRGEELNQKLALLLK